MKGSILKAGWIPGLLLTLVFLLLFLLPSAPLQKLENKLYDVAARKSALAASEDIVIVGIDHASVRTLGHWPWPRAHFARAIDKLTAADARLVVVDVLFENTSYDPELARIASLSVSSPEGQEILQRIRMLNQDKQLSNAVRGNGRVIMPLMLKIGGSVVEPLPPALEPWRVQRLLTERLRVLAAGNLGYPYDALTEAVRGLGFDTLYPDPDGVMRAAPLVLRYGDAFLPSLPLIAAAYANNLDMGNLLQEKPGALQLGALTFPIDRQARVYPRFHRGEDERPYRYVSFARLLADDFPLASLRNKIVLLGFADGVMALEAPTPMAPVVPAVEFHAHVLQSLLEQSFIVRPAWMRWVELGLLLACGLFLMFALPRLHLLWGAVGTLVLALVFVGVDVLLLLFKQLWVQGAGIALFLFLGLLLVSLWRMLTDVPVGGAAESNEQNKMLALTFQSQGMLDMAFEKLRHCDADESVLNQLYNLAMDFERKRQLDKAGDVYEYILGHDAHYRDARERIERLNKASEGASTGGSVGSGMDTLLVAGGAKPTLGRYEIVKELGKGAMGIVYLGRDPKINRYVAIKTLSLNQEFEADDVEEVKARFFREAKTAGMLNHPNIVTMYDVGEEHDLAYIAMEYLDGSDLAPYTKKGKLFPPQATLKICGKVAEALHVAHSQSVIHRDIKPANIMLLKDKTVKVTDFGIARISAASKTKSGVVLGTPSYMSPEQLSGKHIDGRSDLFSLGVMMYEMLSGVRPFRGDSMATLMFQIANEPHPDIREHCEHATESMAKLIDRMLAKDPEARIPNGAEVIRGIIQCLRDMGR